MIDKKMLKQLTVLYVEDDESIRCSISDILKAVVKDVVLAQNGLEGLEKYQECKEIDLIVTDINMPKMDGLQMCHEIRKTDITIPIIVTTAHNENDFLSRAIEAGVSSYLMKPVDAYQLIQEVLKVSEPLFLKKELERVNAKLEQRVALEVEQNVQKDILLQEIIEFQNNMLVVFDENCKPLFTNHAFLKLIHANSLENAITKYGNFESILIENDDYFYPKQHDNDKNWLENLMLLSPKDRIVAILNMDTFLPQAFLVNLYFNEKSGHWICNFSEFTQIVVEKSMYKYKAYTDELTQIHNRAKFNLEFAREIKTFNVVPNYNLSLLIFDIDHFKKFNDTYGHDIGDKVLKGLAELLSMKVRGRDIFARWGGEEFVILLPDTVLKDAAKVAQHLCDEIAQHTFYNELKLTCSFGVTQFKDEDCDLTSLKRADEALYKAKQNGRNRIEIA